MFKIKKIIELKTLIFSFVLLSIFLIPKNAFAYIDPNTGGYIFQILFPILSGIYFAFLFFGRSIKRLLKRIKDKICLIINKIFKKKEGY